MDEYAEWLVGELEQFDQPVDLVGHDWGGLLTGRLVSIRADLVRSWAADAVGGFDAEWEWHEVAKIWQTPGDGEQFMETLRSMPLEERVDTFTAGFGISADDARSMLAANDELMDDCILRLYRSAVDIKKQWGSALGRIDAPGLVLIPAADPLNKPESVERVAARSGARVVTLDGVNHFWPYEAPERAA